MFYVMTVTANFSASQLELGNVSADDGDEFVLRFYGTVNPMGSCRARSVYLTTRLLGRLCPLSG